MKRRDLFFTIPAGFSLTSHALTQKSAYPPMNIALKPPLEHISLWPADKVPGIDAVMVKEEWVLRNPKDGNPNDTAATHVTHPVLMIRQPKVPNGSAILIIPGGGYRRVAVSKSGGAVDDYFASLGTTAFVMTYRLPADGWAAGPKVSLQDAQRAVRIIRANGSKFSIDPNRLCVAGFSAGGHVAGLLGCLADEKTYEPIGSADEFSARPNVLGLFYPVVTMLAPHAHTGSVTQLFPKGASADDKAKLSLESLVHDTMPPTFLAHASDDATVSLDNSLMLYEALRTKKIKSAVHIFDVGGHNLSFNGQTQPHLPLFDAFARRNGWA